MTLLAFDKFVINVSQKLEAGQGAKCSSGETAEKLFILKLKLRCTKRVCSKTLSLDGVGRIFFLALYGCCPAMLSTLQTISVLNGSHLWQLSL